MAHSVSHRQALAPQVVQERHHHDAVQHRHTEHRDETDRRRHRQVLPGDGLLRLEDALDRAAVDDLAAVLARAGAEVISGYARNEAAAAAFQSASDGGLLACGAALRNTRAMYGV